MSVAGGSRGGSGEYTRRGRNWFTAMGAMFLIMAAIVLARQLFLWGPEFVADFFVNAEVTNEKVSLAMIAAGSVLVARGLTLRGGIRVE